MTSCCYDAVRTAGQEPVLKDWRQTPATRWLLTQGPRARSHLELLVDLSQWLCQRGFPLSQVNQYTPTLHPLMQGVECVWHRSGAPPEEIRLHWRAGEDLQSRQASPLRRVMLEMDESSVDLRGTGRPGEEPTLARLRAEGATEHLVMAVPLADGRRNAIGWTTDRDGGFSARERNDLRNLIGPLGLVLDLLEWRRTARTLLDTYLGSGPGREVLGGAIRRGDRRDLDAVILFADLRDFTSKALTWNADQLLQALDAYYQALVDAITIVDGEVLKFVGDGLLAVFPIAKESDLAEACRRAYAATIGARRAMATVNLARGAVGLPPLDFGVALHVGRVVYGNIGGAGRLDFTVIGPAVNLVSRVEGLCKELDHSILTTAAFAEHLPSGFVSIGRHVVRGFAEPVELFAGPEDLAGPPHER
jgi:adenylate cyclase